MALDKVLIVDDDKNICDLLRLYLEKEGYSVILSHDGEEAVVKFNALKPDIVLLDVMLPGLDGWQVCREIRKKSNIPILMITAKSDTYFAYSDAEKVKTCRDLDAAKTKYTLQRSKGLGENEAEMMWLTTMNPETRRLIRVTPDDVTETAKMFDLLLGDNLQGRKDYIAENGSMYLELADIS